MTSRLPTLLIAAALATAAPTRMAALEWKATTQSAVAAPGEDPVRVNFEYRNPTDKVVHVLGVTSSCSCTEAVFPADTIPARAEEKLLVLFSIGKRTGVHEQRLTIRTDDGAPPVQLTIRVTIPAPMPARAPAH